MQKKYAKEMQKLINAKEMQKNAKAKKCKGNLKETQNVRNAK